MRCYTCLVVLTVLIAGCGQQQNDRRVLIAAASAASETTTAATASTATSQKYTTRTGELVNPEGDQVVLLYFDLAGIAPPMDKWIELDPRVRFAQPFEKEPLRKEVRAQFDAGIASVGDVGRLRLTLNATLGNYDPSYGEYLIRDIGPGSMITFEGLGEKVSVKFSNGQVAQVWKVTPEDAKLVQDKVGPYGGVTLDLLLQITGVQPGTANAAITADIVELEMRTNPGGLSVARLKPGSEGAH